MSHLEDELLAYNEYLISKNMKHVSDVFLDFPIEWGKAVEDVHWKTENLTKEIADYASEAYEKSKHEIDQLIEWIFSQYADTAEEALNNIKYKGQLADQYFVEKSEETAKQIYETITRIINELRTQIEGKIKVTFEDLNLDFPMLTSAITTLYNVFKSALFPSVPQVVSTLELLEKAQTQFLKKKWKQYTKGLK